MAVNAPGQPRLSEQLGNSYVGTRDDLEITRQIFFGEISYVVRDPVTFDGHNLSPTDYEVFTSLTKEKSLKEVCQTLIEQGVFEASEQESFYSYVVELQKRNLLNLPVTDSEMLFQQFQQKQQSRTKGLLMKLLFIKVPLGCPDRLLKSTYHLAAGFFTKRFFLLWCVGLIAAIAIIASHWQEFTSDLASALTIGNLPTMLAVMAALKLWHELGHGYACRHYGVSVPNAGILFMIGTPLAFMDATGSWSLHRRIQRQVINLAGMYFELMLTVVASVVWILADDSYVKSVAHFAILISSVTTIACNINPLMKYDGYFVLADALGIPNLKARGAYSARNLFKFLFFRIPMPSCDSKILRTILVSYGFFAGLYRITLTVGIAAVIATQVWLVGLAFGAFYVLSSLGTMFLQLIKYLVWSKEIQDQRVLANAYLVIVTIIIPATILAVPMPSHSHARGVIEHRELAVLHAPHDGFVSALSVSPGEHVKPGQAVATLENHDRFQQRQLKQAEFSGLLVKFRRFQNEDRLKASQTEKELERTRFELDHLRELDPNDKVESPIPGQLIARPDDLQVGQFVESGTEIARIGGSGRIVKAVINASSMATIRPKLGQHVRCRFHAESNVVFDGVVRSISASGTNVVPYEALTHLGGGFIPVKADTLEAAEPFFELEIELGELGKTSNLKQGLVCDIRFGESFETLGKHLQRALMRFHNQIRNELLG